MSPSKRALAGILRCCVQTVFGIELAECSVGQQEVKVPCGSHDTPRSTQLVLRFLQNFAPLRHPQVASELDSLLGVPERVRDALDDVDAALGAQRLDGVVALAPDGLRVLLECDARHAPLLQGNTHPSQGFHSVKRSGMTYQLNADKRISHQKGGPQGWWRRSKKTVSFQDGPHISSNSRNYFSLRSRAEVPHCWKAKATPHLC